MGAHTHTHIEFWLTNRETDVQRDRQSSKQSERVGKTKSITQTHANTQFASYTHTWPVRNGTRKHTDTNTHTYTLSLSFTHSHTLFPSVCLSHTHLSLTHIWPLKNGTCKHTHIRTRFPSLCHTRTWSMKDGTYEYTYKKTQTYTYTRTHILLISLSHTHTWSLRNGRRYNRTCKKNSNTPRGCQGAIPFLSHCKQRGGGVGVEGPFLVGYSPHVLIHRGVNKCGHGGGGAREGNTLIQLQKMCVRKI